MAKSRPVPPAEYSTYPLEKLRALWERAELTETQMMGHLVQHQLDQEIRLRRLEQAMANSGRATEGNPRH